MKMKLKNLMKVALVASIIISAPTAASASLPSGSTYIGSDTITIKGDDIRLRASQDYMSVYAEITHMSGDDSFSYVAKLMRYTQNSYGNWTWVTIDSTTGTLGVKQTKDITFYNIAKKDANMKIQIEYTSGSYFSTNNLFFTR